MSLKSCKCGNCFPSSHRVFDRDSFLCLSFKPTHGAPCVFPHRSTPPVIFSFLFFRAPEKKELLRALFLDSQWTSPPPASQPSFSVFLPSVRTLRGPPRWAIKADPSPRRLVLWFNSIGQRRSLCPIGSQVEGLSPPT